MNGTGTYRRLRRSRRVGQALAELVAGLIAIVVIFMGMVLIWSVAAKHTHALNGVEGARAQAGRDAFLTNYYLNASAVPTWISDWDGGSVWDANLGRYVKVPYTYRDQKISSSPGAVTENIVAHALHTANPVPADLATKAPGNEISAAADTLGMLNGLMLTHGQQKNTVDMSKYPIIRHIVYDTDAIQIQSDAWLTWTHIENVK